MKYSLILTISVLAYSLSGRAAASHFELIKQIQNHFKQKEYSKALALSKMYRDNFFGRSDLTYDHRPILIESFILKKLCLHQTSEQVLEVGKFYAQKYNRSQDVYKKSSQNLKYLEILRGWDDFNSSQKFQNSEIKWPVRRPKEIPHEFYPYLDIEVKSKC